MRRRARGRPCPLCGGDRVRSARVTAGLVLHRCGACGHVAAEHAPDGVPARDYHAQYEAGAFLESLAATRRRQAKDIVARLRGLDPQPGPVLDYGAGRGWFVEVCRSAAIPAGAVDASRLAVDAIRATGARAWLAGADERGPCLPEPARALAPRTLTLLDVVEHFPPGSAAAWLRRILEQLPTVRLVVVKVPDAGGLLHRTARLLARGGATGALEQLYQVGTSPPHLAYFTRRSLRRLLAAAGLRPVRSWGDPDLEPASIADRVAALRRAPRLVRLGARLLAGAVVRANPLTDAFVVIAARDG